MIDEAQVAWIKVKRLMCSLMGRSKSLVDFSFTEEQDLFREAIKEWLGKNLPIEKVREND